MRGGDSIANGMDAGMGVLPCDVTTLSADDDVSWKCG